MDFLYFPEDKTEYIPGIISVIVIFILSMLIMWLLIRASKKQVENLEEQGYSVTYDKKDSDRESLTIEEKPDTEEKQQTAADKDKKTKS